MSETLDDLGVRSAAARSYNFHLKVSKLEQALLPQCQPVIDHFTEEVLRLLKQQEKED